MLPRAEPQPDDSAGVPDCEAVSSLTAFRAAQLRDTRTWIVG